MQKVKLNRRNFLQGIGGLGALAAFPASIQKALAIDAAQKRASLGEISDALTGAGLGEGDVDVGKPCF